MKRTTTLGQTVVALGVALAIPYGLVAPNVAYAQDDKAEVNEDEAEVEETETIELDPEIFDEALADYYEENYAQAAAGFWGYINFGEPSAENYEWAQFFLAECLAALGLWHGAVTYYYLVAKTRSRPEILPDALRRLELITRSRPFSEVLVYEDLLYDSEFGNVPPDLEQWILYVKGLYNYRNSFRRWGDRNFDQLKPNSYYGIRALYVMAVDALRLDKDDKVIALLETIVESKVDAPDVKNDAYLALARLHFDNGRFDDAWEHYDKVEQINLSYQQAQMILEKAWTSFYEKDYRKAMGLLHALDAPSYERFFLPDKFVLRGLIFKDLCHFIPAKRVVRAFRFRYGRTLEEMRRRVPMENIRLIRDGATQDGQLSDRTDFLRSLEVERKRIENWDNTWEDVELDKHLRRLYDLEIREQARRWKLKFDRASRESALDLLDTEEQVNLLDYEVGLDIFQRLKASEARSVREESLVVPYDSSNVYYEFDVEYWNDELHSYKYFINSRCFEKVEGS